MNSSFYRAFEDQHRGPRALIKSRLRAYLPFVEPLKNIHSNVNAVDLGCGRGEWLELLQSVGLDAYGVDVDEGMLAACREAGLTVETNDAVTHLKTLADGSQSVVSAFHLVEHVVFEQLQELVLQAHRVLKPGGLLIMETPNPENIVVATRNFYLDPTHQRPIPPELLSFVAEFYGFARIKIVRLQESSELAGQQNLTLQDVLGGASPDYAIVAQKSASANVLAQLDGPFAIDYGIRLESLSERYQGQISARIEQASSVAKQAEASAQQAHLLVTQAMSTAQQAQSAAQQAEAAAKQAENIAQQAEAVAKQARDAAQLAEANAQHSLAASQLAQIQAGQTHQLLEDVFNSRSWRITAPLRSAMRQIRKLRMASFWLRTKSVIKKTARPFVRRSFEFVRARPVLKNRMIGLASRMGLYSLALSVYRRVKGHENIVSAFPEIDSSPHMTAKPSKMTRRERMVYADITSAIGRNKEII